KFEMIVRELISNMGLTLIDLEVLNDTQIEAVGTITQGKWRNTKKTNQLIRVVRDTNPVPDALVRQVHEAMKNKNANRGIVLATSEYMPGCLDFVQSRPIDLV